MSPLCAQDRLRERPEVSPANEAYSIVSSPEVVDRRTHPQTLWWDPGASSRRSGATARDRPGRWQALGWPKSSLSSRSVRFLGTHTEVHAVDTQTINLNNKGWRAR